MLAVALMSAMSAGVAYANTPERHTPDVIITDSLDGIGAAKIVAKDGSGTINITEKTSLSCSLFVREGKVVVVGNGVKDEITLSIEPGSPYSTYGSLIVAGKDAEVVFDKAVYYNGSNAFIRIGGYDGNGSLKLINGSSRTSGDCELFTIGVNAMPAPEVTASPQCTTKGGSGSDSSDPYEGTYAPASNGSGAAFGRGDVVVSGGSEIELSHRSFWMGEGTLTVEGGSKATAGDYRGFRTLMGVGENTTSEIIVKQGSSMDIYAGTFVTSISDSSTSNITIDGNGTQFKVHNMTGDTVSEIGYEAENTVTNINVTNGASMDFDVEQVLLGMEKSGNVVNINVGEQSALGLEAGSVLMREGTTITNSGTIEIDTNPNKAFFMLGGEIINNEGAEIIARDLYAYASNADQIGISRRIVNKGTYTVSAEFYLGQSEFINEGTMNGTVYARSGVRLTNGGVVNGTISLNGTDAVVTSTHGSTVNKVDITNGRFVVAGNVTATGDVKASPDVNGNVNAQLVFTEDGLLNMGGNSLTLGDIQVILQVDGHVGQMTSVDNKEFFTNYSSSDFSDDMEVVVVGSDGSTSIRKAGDLNYGAFLTGSGNQKSVYNAIEKMVADGVASDALVAISELKDSAALEAALDALSGHEYATAMSSQIDGNMGHLRRLRESMGKGAALSLEGIAPQGDGKCGMTTRQPLVGGISVYHEESKLDADAHGDGYDRTENGAMVNVECQVKENVTLGGAITYGRTKLHSANAMNRYEDNTRLDAYALYGDKAWSFATSFGLGMHEHELKRALGRDEVDGYSINFMQEAAYTVYGDEDSSVQLVGTLESSWNKLDSISDGRLRSNDLSAWSTDVTAGVRYNCALRAWGNAPAGMFSAQAGVRTSVGDINPSMELGMGGYTWRQDCAKSNRWGWSLSAGVDVPVRTDVSVFGAAETVLRGDYNSAGGQVGVRVAF